MSPQSLAPEPAAPTPRTHPYAAFIHAVLKPARYLGGEYLAVTKDWDAVELRVCMAFPEIYDIGMSHLGTKIIYAQLGRDPKILCERAFTPWVDMEAELRRRGLPLVSLESARPLRDFDVVGISLQYEMTYTNALNLLELGGIPLRSAQRGEGDPLVLAGGPTVTHPEPMAPFIDAFLIGDAEEAFPTALHAIVAWKAEGLPRAEQLRRLARQPGWYVPALYTTEHDERTGFAIVVAPDPGPASGGAGAPYPIKRTIVSDLNKFPFPDDAPVAAAEAIFDRMSIEIARGCTEGCRFCQAGMIYRPVRERDPEQIVDTVIAALDKGGYDEVSLTSLSTADYSCVSPLIKRVMEKLRERRASLSVSSLRAYGLDEDLLDEISTVKATGLTFAPEAGTQRMRDVVNKNITEEDLIRTAHRVFKRGWTKMKFYFMIGLPSETDEDVDGIVETAARARDVGWEYHKRNKVQVTASVSSHVPKPHTPFQWAPMDTVESLEKKQWRIRDLGKKLGVQTKWHNWRESFIEGILARGDRKVAELVELVFKKGARLDSWDDQIKFDLWLEAIRELGIDPSRYTGTIPVDARLPWDHIDVGLEPGFLAQEWKRAMKNRLSPPCGKPVHTQVHATNVADAVADQRKLVCYHCGIACDMTQMRSERITFLEKLGAHTKDDVRAEGFTPAYQAVRKDLKGRNLPPLRASQGATHRYRLVFTKLGTVALTSHLDLARTMPRVLRRAGLGTTYSEGFAPHALISYGPALSLGVRSIAEVCDVFLRDELTPEELLARLVEKSDPGLVVLRAAVVPLDAPVVTKLARVAEYTLVMPGASELELQAALARARMPEPVMVEVIRKHGPKPIDVRDGLLGLAVDRSRPEETRWLGTDPGAMLLRWRVNLVTGAHVRPADLARGLLGVGPEDLLAARTMLLAETPEGLTDLLDPRVMVRPASQGARHDATPDRGDVPDLADSDDAPLAEACE